MVTNVSVGLEKRLNILSYYPLIIGKFPDARLSYFSYHRDARMTDLSRSAARQGKKRISHICVPFVMLQLLF